MKWFLVVWIFNGGMWHEGDPKEGWGPMEQPSEAVCIQKRDKANDLQGDNTYRFTCEER